MYNQRETINYNNQYGYHQNHQPQDGPEVEGRGYYPNPSSHPDQREYNRNQYNNDEYRAETRSEYPAQQFPGQNFQATANNRPMNQNYPKIQQNGHINPLNRGQLQMPGAPTMDTPENYSKNSGSPPSNNIPPYNNQNPQNNNHYQDYSQRGAFPPNHNQNGYNHPNNQRYPQQPPNVDYYNQPLNRSYDYNSQARPMPMYPVDDKLQTGQKYDRYDQEFYQPPPNYNNQNNYNNFQGDLKKSENGPTKDYNMPPQPQIPAYQHNNGINNFSERNYPPPQQNQQYNYPPPPPPQPASAQYAARPASMEQPLNNGPAPSTYTAKKDELPTSDHSNTSNKDSEKQTSSDRGSSKKSDFMTAALGSAVGSGAVMAISAGLSKLSFGGGNSESSESDNKTKAESQQTTQPANTVNTVPATTESSKEVEQIETPAQEIHYHIYNNQTYENTNNYDYSQNNYEYNNRETTQIVYEGDSYNRSYTECEHDDHEDEEYIPEQSEYSSSESSYSDHDDYQDDYQDEDEYDYDD